MRKLIVKVKEIKGKCDIMKIGDYFILDGGKLILPDKNKHVCIYALSSLLPLLPAKQRNIVEPEDWPLKIELKRGGEKLLFDCFD
jgi:carbon-monoxide dehydrogenase iron sulfur subunit